jgi:DHA2 family multidrug resistance protein-like MFS transporter
VLLASLVLFGVGSAVCAGAWSSGTFIAARVLLGLAGAGVIVMALSALTVLFDEDERPKAVGAWAAANFLAFPIGPILGGWLLAHYWWGWVFLLNVPVAVVGFLAAFAFVPESRAPTRPALDPVGIALSVAGLLSLTYGLIEAGEHGWAEPGALVPMIAGVCVLVGFLRWELKLTRRPDGEPLVDMALFRSGSYTWGVILVAVAILAMVGVLFTMPQYFQGVVGTDPMGSGVRLLPLVGGLVLGALPADRVARVAGAKVTTAAGFALLTAGLALGATTSLGSGDGFVAAWMAAAGAGMGLALATATSSALSQLPEERSGVGSAMLQALNKLGGPLGTAVLGSVLSSAYLARLDLSGVPAPAAGTVRQSVFGGAAIGEKLGSPALLHSVRAAFVHGMDLALVVSACIAVAGAILAAVFLPRGRVANPAERGARKGAAVAGAR